MIEKCANHACCAQFRYLHEGKLFVMETDGPDASAVTRGADSAGKVRTLQHFWLCDTCCKTMVVTHDPHDRVKVIPHAGPIILQAS
ncbi:MAG: hypothetical protein LAN64_00840 [Acidobacteriia bacterium]|nr:hypothetical protein [Terriglobia bacterium]